MLKKLATFALLAAVGLVAAGCVTLGSSNQQSQRLPDGSVLVSTTFVTDGVLTASQTTTTVRCVGPYGRAQCKPAPGNTVGGPGLLPAAVPIIASVSQAAIIANAIKGTPGGSMSIVNGSTNVNANDNKLRQNNRQNNRQTQTSKPSQSTTWYGM